MRFRIVRRQGTGFPGKVWLWQNAGNRASLCLLAGCSGLFARGYTDYPRAEPIQCVYITGTGYCIGAHLVIQRLTASLAVRVLVACVLIANRVVRVGIADLHNSRATTGFRG